MDDYGIPQMRKRSIFLLTRKDISQAWDFPNPKNKILTLKDVINDLPTLDPIVSDANLQTEKVFPRFHKKLEETQGFRISLR